MRMHRALSGLIVTALLGLAPLGLASSAEASEAGVVKRQAVSQAAGDLPKRKVTAKIIEPRRNKLVLKGMVGGDYGNKPVLIQKRNCLRASCKWHQHAKVRTNKRGQYRSGVTAPRNGYDYWRAKVAKSGGYGVSYSKVWRTYSL